MKLKSFRTFLAKPIKEKGCLVEAAVWLGISRFVLLNIPFKRIAPYLGVRDRDADNRPLESLEELAQVKDVAHAVQGMAGHLPWECKCLVQAISAKMMLKRRHIASTLYLGVLKKDDFAAHAWLRAGDVILTGEASMPQCTVVSVFT